MNFPKKGIDTMLKNRNGSSSVMDWGDGSKANEEVVHLGEDYSCFSQKRYIVLFLLISPTF